MKSFAKLAVVGISGVFLFKLFATILFPLLGLMLGLLMLTVKLAVIAAVIVFIWSIVKRPRRADEREIVVETEPETDA